MKEKSGMKPSMGLWAGLMLLAWVGTAAAETVASSTLPPAVHGTGAAKNNTGKSKERKPLTAAKKAKRDAYKARIAERRKGRELERVKALSGLNRKMERFEERKKKARSPEAKVAKTKDAK